VQTTKHLTQEQIQGFEEDGYLVVKGLIAPEEIRDLVDNFIEMHKGVRSPAASSLRTARRRTVTYSSSTRA